MPVARFQMPDGRIGRFEVPEGTTPEQAQSMIAKSLEPQPQDPTNAPPATIGSKLARGMVDPIEGGAQLLYNVLPKPVQKAGDKLNNWLADKGVPIARMPDGGMNQLAKTNEADYQATRPGDSGFDWARLGGNVLSPANLVVAGQAMKAAPIVSKVLNPLQITSKLPGQMLSGATASAAQSALMPVTEGDFWSEKGGQVGTGAAVGAALPMLGKLIPKRTDSAKELMAKGVDVPFLQQFGQGAGRFEDKLQSVPLLGDAIRSSRISARDQFNKSTWNEVLSPIGQKLPNNIQAGNKSAEYAQKRISAAYNAILPKIGFSADDTFNADMSNLRNLASGLPEAQKDQFENILKIEVFNRLTPSGLMSGESIKRAESRLGAKMRTAMRSDNVWDGDLADALHEAQSVIRTTLERQNPAHAPTLQAINKAQSMAYRPERAASMLGAKEGVFSPAQLLSAVKAKDTSKGSRAFAQGRASMQDFAQKADRTLSSQIPDSGTTERLLLSGGALGGLSMVPTIGQVAAGATMLPYLPYGGRALGRGVANVLDESANAFTKRSPYAALPLNPAIYGLLNGSQDK